MAVGTFGEECATGHHAMIYDRGGMNRIDTLIDLNSVKWGRTRNGVTDGEIVLTARSCNQQQDIIDAIEPHRHEMILFRGDERVWEGPILQVNSQSNTARILAHDVGEYLLGTPLSVDWPSAEGDLMTDRIRDILTHELTVPYTAIVGTGTAAAPREFRRWEQLDPPANILPFLEVRNGTVLTFSNTIAFEMSVGEHIANLARSGVDFTVVGRKILVWDSAVAIGRTRQLTESDFYGDPEVISSGADHASIYHVMGQQQEAAVEEDPPVPDAPAVVGNAGIEDPYYGVWTIIHTADGEGGDSSQDALNSQAQRGLVGRTPVPIELRLPGSAGLRLSHDLTIQHLVPGVEMPVLAQLNLRKLSQMQVLDKMTVTETSAGENISVTLVPSGPAQIASRGMP